MGNIISQEVIYYKYKIGETKTNMYGEASEGRTFADPVMLFALVEVAGSTQSAPVSDLGVDFNWPLIPIQNSLGTTWQSIPLLVNSFLRLQAITVLKFLH
jgi:hypothetical protein